MTEILSVLVMGFLGSLHCVGMCGPISALAHNSNNSKILSGVLYQIGRLGAYFILYLGVRSLSWGLSQVIQVDWAKFSKSLIILGTLFLLCSVFGIKIKMKLPGARILSVYLGRFRQLQIFPLFLGLFTLFLPCPWLYGFIGVSAGQPQASTGLLMLTAFWLGTLPSLVLVQSVTRLINRSLTRPFQKGLISALIVLAAIVSWARVTTFHETSNQHCHH
ncbi:MAG: sulfite exporter TauE/SafE family protein [Oligoflexia bacterium]|nr:sulfite exporter TauE/SafE family protein [Oligoflexia bacterium]